jgi:hypothetical protein
LLSAQTQRLLNLTVSNAGVELSQFCRHVSFSSDFSKSNRGVVLVTNSRCRDSSFLDALPAGDKVPRVVLAAPRQPVFDVLIRQPVVGSNDMVTIVVQCKSSELQEQIDEDLTEWVGKVGTSIKSESAMSASESAATTSGSCLLPPPAKPRRRMLDAGLASSAVTSGRLFLYVAARRITDNKLKMARSTACVLPLDLLSLKYIYGPTIARCHIFIMQTSLEEEYAYSKEIAASVKLPHVTGKTL